MAKIMNRYNGEVIVEGDELMRDLAIKNKKSLLDADLRGIDLSVSNFDRSNFESADFGGSDLKYADFRDSNLKNSNLSNVDAENSFFDRTRLRAASIENSNFDSSSFADSDLRYAKIRNCTFEYTNFRGADLRGIGIMGLDLRTAYLSGAKIEFYGFPSIRSLSFINLGSLSDFLTLELMRRDAYAHPHPERFDEWAAEGNNCPYRGEERFWYFSEKAFLWKPGDPQMTDRDLIKAICEEKGWKLDY